MEKWKAALFSYPSKMKDYLFYKKSFASIPLDKSMDLVLSWCYGQFGSTNQTHDCHGDLVNRSLSGECLPVKARFEAQSSYNRLDR